MASEPIPIPGSIRFGEDFEFDFRTSRLRRSGRVLKLERIPTEVLAVLVEQRGQVVSREHIVERIWGKNIFLDTNNSINGAIRKVRQVLKDNAEEPRFIQTVTGRGYRFIAPVTDPETQRLLVVPRLRVPEPPVVIPAIPKRTISRRTIAFAIFIFFFMLVLGGYLWSRSHNRSLAAKGRLMLAVLPFENLTGDTNQDYVSDGMTEEVIARLGSLDPEYLRVIARTSVMQYKHNKQALDQIGRQLQVQYALEGSIRRDAGKVRITAQLIQIKDQSHLWAKEYDREAGNLLTIQGEIAQEIANEIQSMIGGKEPLKSTSQVPLSP